MLDEAIQFTCNWCGESVLISAPSIEWDLWFTPDRPVIQRVFPTMSDEDREMLISGTCSVCFDKMFGPG